MAVEHQQPSIRDSRPEKIRMFLELNLLKKHYLATARFFGNVFIGRITELEIKESDHV